MRSRNYIYCIKNPDINRLQSIECKYHIYGYLDGELHGYIHFMNTKTQIAAEKIIEYPIQHLETSLIDEKQRIMKMENVWEKGAISKRGRKKSEQDLDEMVIKENLCIQKLCSVILQQQDENKRLQEKLEESLKKQVALVSTTPVQQTIHNDARDFSKNKKITNINVFLNTECKDAITLQEFVHDIEIRDEDILCLKEYGYVESVSRLLKRALKEYDVCKRPLHCSDMKREILHVKDQEGWKKETPTGETPTIDKAFLHISHKQTKKMTEVYRDIPIESPKFEEKASVLYKLTQGAGSGQEKAKKKIIKSIAESVHI